MSYAVYSPAAIVELYKAGVSIKQLSLRVQHTDKIPLVDARGRVCSAIYDYLKKEERVCSSSSSNI